MTAYYNEIDPYAAQWLRNLIDAGHIAHGIVDTRSIEDVHPRDIDGFIQCHFFAGIGVWSYALRLAGWPDERPVWTGSCPCQPFSTAGKGAGFTDERHLWPAWFHLISECRPAVIFGEQVASSDAGPWIDLVQDDLEGLGHAFGAVPFPAAGVGAPHIRQRLFFVGYADDGRGRRHAGAVPVAQGRPRRRVRGFADGIEPSGSAGLLADASGSRWGIVGRGGVTSEEDQGPHPDVDHETRSWDDCDWVDCRDGRRRPVEPGTFPLVARAAFELGRDGPYAGKSRSKMLKGYGNAINAQAAAAFIRAADMTSAREDGQPERPTAGGSETRGGRDVAPRQESGDAHQT